MKRRNRPSIALVAFFVATTAIKPCWGERQDGEDPTDPEHRAEAPDRPADMPLADLPAPPPLKLAPPRPRAIEAIDRLLAELAGDDPVLRERAQRSLLEAKTDWVAGIARRMDQIAERADRGAMDRLLGDLRKKAPATSDDEAGGSGEASDYLNLALSHPSPESETWRDLTSVLALNRMLSAIGTTEAVREIVRLYARFGEAVRIDCQRRLDELGDRAVAGLIESTRHPAPAISDWAKKRLRLLGKTSAHDAVNTDDQVALADILIALGRNGDPESTRLLVSFAGTDDAKIRHAARQGITLLGEVSAWQLRDAYQDTTGRTPPRDWTWKRTARELFTEYDRLRQARVYALYEEAKKALAAGDLEKMSAGFDKVLLLEPNFGRGDEMALGYRKLGDSLAETEPDKALLALRRALRIDSNEKTRAQTKSTILLLEAKRLRETGVIDRALLEQARRLDPEKSDEAQQLSTPGQGALPWGSSSRYLVAGSVSLIALGGAAWIALSTLRRRGKEQPREKATPDPSAVGEPPHAAQRSSEQDDPEAPADTPGRDTPPASDDPKTTQGPT